MKKVLILAILCCIFACTSCSNSTRVLSSSVYDSYSISNALESLLKYMSALQSSNLAIESSTRVSDYVIKYDIEILNGTSALVKMNSGDGEVKALILNNDVYYINDESKLVIRVYNTDLDAFLQGLPFIFNTDADLSFESSIKEVNDVEYSCVTVSSAASYPVNYYFDRDTDVIKYISYNDVLITFKKFDTNAALNTAHFQLPIDYTILGAD